MAKFAVKSLIRAGSIFVSVGLLKISLDGILTGDDVWVRIISIIGLVFVPIIFLLANVMVNRWDDRNKGMKK